MAKEKAAERLQLHNTQGFEYTSQAYFNLTKEDSIVASMLRRGPPMTASWLKNFSMLKTECIHRQNSDSFEQAEQLIDDHSISAISSGFK